MEQPNMSPTDALAASTSNMIGAGSGVGGGVGGGGGGQAQPPAPLPLPTNSEGQTYCLRWNNHKSNLIEILDALIKVESYVDCTIIVDDQVQFKAHRVVLAANSPYFQSILQDVPMDHCSIIFPGVKAFEMRALLEYMYTGEVNVTQSQIPQIMRIAEELEVKGLFDMADLKEKFNKLNDEQAESVGNPYACSAAPTVPYTSAATSSTTPHNGSQDHVDAAALHSSSVISTSSNISPSAAPSSSSSPPYNSYKSPYTNMFSKSPAPSALAAQTQASVLAQTPTHQQSQSSAGAERAQWPISAGMPAAAAAMLSAVYESAPDMNPLKRKKLSSISSMLMNRDTPILRNVLAQSNPADSSQPMPLLLPGGGNKVDKASTHNNNHSFNGSDYSSEKQKYPEEPHSPYTDRSFEDDGFDPKGNFGANPNNQKPEWKRYKQYTRNDIMSAIQCVRDGMSALQASRKFGVPSRTLYDKVKKLGITTGRPMNRTMKRSPSNVETSAAFPYAHGYGQSEPLLSSLHDSRDERDMSKEHPRVDHHMSHGPTIPHQAAALLDHALLQQALENRGGDIAGREALHAMALAAAAHAAVNRMSASPGPNGTARSPSPNFVMKYARNEHELMLEREKERRHMERERERELDLEHERELEREREQNDCERDADDEDDHVEDLSVTRKDCHTPDNRRADSPYSPPPAPLLPAGENNSVIMPPMCVKLTGNSNDDFMMNDNGGVKREIISDDGRAD